MKILLLVDEYADRPLVRVDWRQAQYFRDGEGPRPGSMITLDLPGFKGELEVEAIVAWLTKDENRGIGGLFKKKKEVHEFSRRHWEYTELDDLLEAVNTRNMIWNLSEHFTVEEMVEFERRRMPEAWELVEAWKKRAFKSEEKRYQALREIESDFVNRHAVAHAAGTVIEKTISDYETRRDEALLEEFLKKPRRMGAWIDLAERLTSNRGTVLVADAFGKFVNEEAKDSEALLKILQKIHGREELRERLTWQRGFWKHFERRLAFPANVDGEEIDISQATEVVVPSHFDLLESKRVGVITPGRRALRVPGDRWRGTYIKGGRGLKFEVEEAGGALRKYGCTLVSSGGSIQELLREAEELILLSNLAPEQALQKIEDLEVPSDPPVFDAAERAREDYRYARILADLLIELRTGIDATVARARLGM